MRKRSDDERGDVFDHIMSVQLLSPIKPFYQNHKEPLLYLFFGGLTTALSIACFWFLVYPCSREPLAANVVTWVVCVAFAYITNRTWVFEHSARDARGIVREGASFVVGRLSTLALEELVLWVGIGLLNLNSLLVKTLAQVLVIVGNYIISKWLVFTKH